MLVRVSREVQGVFPQRVVHGDGGAAGRGGLREAPQLVPGRGGAAVIESFSPKFHVTGEPGREITCAGTASSISCACVLSDEDLLLTLMTSILTIF